MSEQTFRHLAKMPAFWNAVRRQKWTAAHDVIAESEGTYFGTILQWRDKSNGQANTQ